MSVTGVATDRPLLALTFDDGPDPRLTQDVLDVLGAAGVRATFLVVAQRVRDHPELGRRVVAAGHEIGLHGDVHVELPGLPFRRQLGDLRRGRRDVEALLGVRVRWFRPPYGKQEPETVLACRLAGMRPLLWNSSSHDWQDDTYADQLTHASAGLRPGAIVLLHDGAASASEPFPTLPRHEPRLAEELLALVQARSLAAVTVSELCAAGSVVEESWFERWLHH